MSINNRKANVQYVGSAEMDAETLNLYDMTGKLLMSKSLSLGLNSIQLPLLAKGIYTYSITTGGKILQRDKLLIE